MTQMTVTFYVMSLFTLAPRRPQKQLCNEQASTLVLNSPVKTEISGALCGRKGGSSLNQLELISAQKYRKLKT